MEKLNHNDKKRIQEYIKNKIDISPLLEGKLLKDEDLSHSIIKKLSRTDEDLSGCNLSYSIIGDESNIISFLRCNMTNCNFSNVKFIGRTWMRYCDVKNSNFKNADVSNVDYRFSDFRNSNFCNSKITISTTSGVGCKFSPQLFEELCKGWLLDIKATEKE